MIILKFSTLTSEASLKILAGRATGVILYRGSSRQNLSNNLPHSLLFPMVLLFAHTLEYMKVEAKDYLYDSFFHWQSPPEASFVTMRKNFKGIYEYQVRYQSVEYIPAQCVKHSEENKTQMRRTEFRKKFSHHVS